MTGHDLSSARIVVTGGRGFLGWHVAVRLRAIHGNEAVVVGRADFQQPELLREAVRGADVVVHLAGVNRAGSDDAVEQGNVEIAQALADQVRDAGRPLTVVYGNTVQAEQDNAYGRGKRRAADCLGEAVRASGGVFVDVLLPNLFGEHGRPHYNSFVATFCHLLVTGGTPQVQVDRAVPLLHVQDAAEQLLEAATLTDPATLTPAAEEHLVSDVLTQLESYREIYRSGDVPPLPDSFSVNLFNTYRSHLFPERFPIYPQVHADERGALFEAVRSHAGPGMAFVSTTRPGKVRGDHYHLRKIERFLVVSGEAEISLRRLLHDDIVTFRVTGDRPGFVDMPTMWVHNIRNVGSSELVTMFWADQLLDVANPDQYPEKVVQEVTS